MSSYLEDPCDEDDRDLNDDRDEEDDRGVTEAFEEELDEMVGGNINEDDD